MNDLLLNSFFVMHLLEIQALEDLAAQPRQFCLVQYYVTRQRHLKKAIYFIF